MKRAWQTGGQPDAKNDVPPLSPEAMAIANVTVALCVHVLQVQRRGQHIVVVDCALGKFATRARIFSEIGTPGTSFH